MQAIHSFWSKPNKCRNHDNIRIPDYELCTAVLSALKWQENNGPIRLITDSAGADYFRKQGISSIWSDIDISLDKMDKTTDPFLFWAAGKLYALLSVKEPCAMLDTDLIIWKDLSPYFDKDIVSAHSEGLNPEVYPDPFNFTLKEGYHFPPAWDFSLDASNTAFLYIKDLNFKEYYVNQAIDFFNNVELKGLNPVTAMCFAEQRILPMCAKEKGKKIDYLIELENANNQEFVTHTWGFKQILASSEDASKEFCTRCIQRLLKDFPDKKTVIECSSLSKYII